MGAVGGHLESRSRLGERWRAYVGKHSAEGGLVVQVVEGMIARYTGHVFCMLVVGDFQVAQRFTAAVSALF